MLVIPTYIETVENKLIIKMALQMNRRAWINKLWNKPSTFNFE